MLGSGHDVGVGHDVASMRMSEGTQSRPDFKNLGVTEGSHAQILRIWA
jgi:hypothetical protein